MPAKTTRLRIFFAGVGGQGSLTASRLLGEIAMEAGYDVLVSELHGMSQRGGVVESSVFIGYVFGSILEDGEADLLVAFEPLEMVRAIAKASQGTTVLCNTRPILPSTVSRGQARYPGIDLMLDAVRPEVGQLVSFDATDLAVQAGSVLATNMVMLGATCASGILPFAREDYHRVIEDKTPERFRETNIKAFEAGYRAVTEAR